MPELIDEINALKKALGLIEAEIRSIKETGTKGGESVAALQAELADLKKHRDEIREKLDKLGKQAEPAPPAKPLRQPKGGDDDDDERTESGFW